MSGPSAPGSPSASGFLGVLRSWLRAKPFDDGPSSSDSPLEAVGSHLRVCGSVRMLVVDDNLVNLMLITSLMEWRGLVPLLASDGAEAVALACELQFDLILMDLQMPILDGLEATSAIRLFEAQSSRPAVPVVTFSSMTLGAGVLTAHGFNGSLAKPCGDQELEECLVRWCPTYRSAPATRGHGHGNHGWVSANRGPGTSRGLLR